jgi:endonuclease YncB( thermonuclease family)
MIRPALILASVMVAWPASAAEFGICTGGNRAARKVTCLVDGDTGWHVGRKWRLKGADTPEYPPRAECKAEAEHAKESTYHALDLLRAGYEIEWLGEKTGDREMARIRLADGRQLADALISDGMAVHWPHREGIWCE